MSETPHVLYRQVRDPRRQPADRRLLTALSRALARRARWWGIGARLQEHGRVTMDQMAVQRA